jgi:flagellar protein FlbD
MLKLTRLNHHTIAINPDHISWVEATPDTTLFLINGEKLLVRETLDELMHAVIEYRRLVRMVDPAGEPLGPVEGDPPRVGDLASARKPAEFPRRRDER